MVEYDVLGNERHKAVCELRKLKCKSGLNGSFVCELASVLNVPKDSAPYEDAVLHGLIRDQLIHLLGGDTPNLSDLLKEDDDAVDARPSDAASADSPDHGSAGCACGSCCGVLDEGVAPITTELRNNMRVYRRFSIDDGKQHVELDVETFGQLCDNIDAIHAGLERENDELQKRTKYPAETERVNMLEREVKRLESECKTQHNNFDQATSAREHWKNLYEQALEQIHDLERDYKTACYINERQDCEYADLAKRYDKTISLPFDKDGKVWDVGDELLDDGMVCEVVGIGPNRLYYYCDATDTVEWTQADSRRHYHAPTVEDVLREFTNAWAEWKDGAAMMNPVETFAAKLKLADA